MLRRSDSHDTRTVSPAKLSHPPAAAEVDGARRWRPALALRVSGWLHAGGALAAAAQPEAWPVIAGTLIANHLLFAGACLWPRSRLLGDNIVRLPPAAAQRGEVAVTFDDGPDPEVTPRVLDLLDQYGAKGSFFCIGERVAAWPHIAREIARRGHSVENHSLRHSTRFGWYWIGALRQELATAQLIIADATGRAPLFFRAPFGTRSPLLDPALARYGLRLVSWTRRGFDTVDQDAARVSRRLIKGLARGDVLLLHDGITARARHGEATTLAVLPILLRELDARGLTSVSLPAACSERPTS
jgi:peptidoglycan/xylan/chitin deacetylase (PgdA/CDA1 family)